MMNLITKRIVNHSKTIDYLNQCRTCSGLVSANHCLGLARLVVEVRPGISDQWVSTVVLDLVEALLAGLVDYLVLADVSTEEPVLDRMGDPADPRALQRSGVG